MSKNKSEGIFASFVEYDRRWIYLILLVVITVSLIFPFEMPITVSPDTKNYYNVLNNLDEGDRVLFSISCEFSGYMETQAGAMASMRMLMEKNTKIAVILGHPEAVVIPELIWTDLDMEMKRADYQYGRDYVNLGYIMPNEASVAALAEDFKGTIKQDYKGQSLTGTFLEDVNDWQDFHLIVDLSGGSTNYLRSHFALRGTPMIEHATGTLVIREKAYLDSGLYKALLGGMRGGAELEYLIGHPGPGMTSMNAFTLGHYIVIIFIVIGNIGYYGYTAKKKAGGG